MADTTIYQLGTTTSRTNAILWVQRPDATPSGWRDYQITPENLIAAERTRITTLETNYTALEARVTTVESQLSKTVYSDAVSTFPIAFDAGDLLTRILIKSTNGTLIISGGVSVSEDIFREREISDGEYEAIPLAEPFASSGNLYITITQGRANITVWKDTGN